MTKSAFTRRSVVGGIAVAGALAGLNTPLVAQTINGRGHRKITIAWSSASVCHSPISVAAKRGFFAEQGLDVEQVNHAGQTDSLLQSIATGHADGGVGMSLRWLKPLEQGFDVRVPLGTHGGCIRLLATKDSGIKTISDLRGKSVAVTDRASPELNFFAIRAKKLGIENPYEDINWVQYPADLFGEAVARNEVQAAAATDPLGYVQREHYGLVEIANNLDDEYAHAGCCILGLRGALVRDEPKTAAALTQAFVAAQQWAAHNPDETAEIFLPNAPSSVTAKDIATILRSHTHGHNLTGDALRADISRFASELKLVGVLRQTTDPDAFAAKIVADV